MKSTSTQDAIAVQTTPSIAQSPSLTNGVMDGIFGGPRESGELYVPTRPFAPRFNCKAGSINRSETERICDNARITIVKLDQLFGNLGKTMNTEWLQLWYFPLLGEELPNNTLCVSYLKTESVSLFFSKVTELQAQGINVAEGVFTVGFSPRQGKKGRYFAVEFDWSERQGEQELHQLELIAAAIQDGLYSNLVDLDGTRDMVSISDLSPEQIPTLRAACIQGLPPHLGLQVALGSKFDDVMQSWERQQQVEAQKTAN